MSQLPPYQQPACESGLSHNSSLTHTGGHNLRLQNEMSFTRIQRSPPLNSNEARGCPRTNYSKKVTDLRLSLCAVGLVAAEEPIARTLQESGCLLTSWRLHNLWDAEATWTCTPLPSDIVGSLVLNATT